MVKHDRGLVVFAATIWIGCAVGGTGASGCGSSVEVAGSGTMTTTGSGGTGGANVCAPGQQIACACPGGTQGVQACLQDGSGFSSCQCGTGGTGGQGGTGTGGTGGANVCTPGSTKECYSGPPATKDVGSCVSGIQTCNPDGGDYGPCTGEIVPAMEDCATPADDNCDGSPGPCPITAWSRGSGSALDDGYAVATSGDDVIVAGIFTDTLDFGAGPMSATGPGQNGFLVRFDPMGQVLWQKAFATTADTGMYAYKLAVDPSGNILLAGSFAGSMSFGGAILTSTGPSINNWDAFVAKFDSQGKHLWSKGFGGTTGADISTGISTDSSGNVLVTGTLIGPVDFGAGAVPCGNTYSLFVAKYNPQGTLSFGNCYGTSGSSAVGTAADAAGNIVLAGRYEGSLIFGGTILSGHNDFFVAKLDGSGNGLWGKTFGDNDVMYYQEVHDVAVDASGNILLAGQFHAPLDLGGGALPAPSYANAFVAKLDGNGQHVWSKSYGKSGGYISDAAGVAVDPSGNVLVTGSFEGDVDFGGGVLQNPAGANVFVLKLGSMGNHVSSQSFGDMDVETGRSCAFDMSGARAIAGTYKGTLDFGQGPLPLVNNGQRGVFVARLAP